MSQWGDLLSDIKKIEKKHGGSLREPASIQEIIRMKNILQEKTQKLELPDQYINFLENVNGFDFNGLVIYGVDEPLLDNKSDEEIHGFIETNEIWHENEWQRQYVFFGDSDTAWYCYDLNENVFLELDKPSGTLMQSFEDFDTMLKDAIETSL